MNKVKTCIFINDLEIISIIFSTDLQLIELENGSDKLSSIFCAVIRRHHKFTFFDGGIIVIQRGELYRRSLKKKKIGSDFAWRFRLALIHVISLFFIFYYRYIFNLLSKQSYKQQ